MRRRILKLIAVAAALTVVPQAARAYCMGWDKELPGYRADYYSVPQEFGRARYVAEIQVVRETWLGEDGKPKPLQPPFQNHGSRPWGFDPYIGAYYDVLVLRRFKGEPSTRLRLYSENSTARFQFKVGSRWLAFVTEEDEEVVGHVLTLDTCGNLQPWTPRSKAAFEVLRLASPRPSSARR
jgi:hypothetical protein